MLALHNADLELYVIDGASTDGTVAYLQALPAGQVDWHSEPDRGIYDAMNKGWNKVPPSRFVLYMGAGDTVTTLPTNETLQTCFDRGDRIVIGTCHIGNDPFVSSWTDRLSYNNTAHHQALLIWRALAGRSPFDASMRVYADWEFNLRLFNQGLRAHFDPTFQTYAEPDGVSARHDLREICRVSFRHGGLRIATPFVPEESARRVAKPAQTPSRSDRHEPLVSIP